ncbi:ATP-binding protein [Terrihabitans soli]|uniref:Murein endopeptidase K n=1 Tax=Terrihabitans soli TaxID=708113 RepID=A0A6S6QHZ5_9HYPH|nr:DUF882 domain-containing protein [Terrihabitans soli]BCJ89824.1 ATP-binding protein [Terrihabitans soli]
MGAFVIAGAETTQTAIANGDTRTLSFYHTHSQERITVTFKREGRYDKDGLKKLNHFLRDWRNQKETTMEPRLFDVVWEVQKDAGSDAPIQIISAYRSPETNEKLRSRSKGVAKHSQHMLGRAMDIHVPDVSMAKIREAGLRLQRGGVGFYPTSAKPFVHLDVGSVRHWPRMTRDQLVRLFPDGRTVHLPTDGIPLKNYKLALADVAKNGGTARGMTDTQIAEAQRNQGKAGTTSGGRGFLTKFLAGDDEDDAPGVPGPDEVMPASAPEETPAAYQAIAEAVPMPAPRPSEMGGSTVVAAYAPEQPFPAGPEMIWRSGPASSPAYPQTTNSASANGAPMPAPRPQTTPYALASVDSRIVQPNQPITASLAPGASLAEERTAALRLLGQLGQSAAPSAAPQQPAEGDAIGHILAAHDAFSQTASVPQAAQRPAKQQASRMQLATLGTQPVALTAGEAPKPSLSPVRTARNPDLDLNHPNFARDDLISAPTGGVLSLQFGGNPNSGMRSDAFMGSSVAVLRTVNFGPQRTALLTNR